MNFKKSVIAGVISLAAGLAMAADLPQVAILATGGTIAGTASSNTQMTGYKAGELAIQTLIDAVPAVKEFVEEINTDAGYVKVRLIEGMQTDAD